MFCLSISWCAKTLCEEVVQLRTKQTFWTQDQFVVATSSRKCEEYKGRRFNNGDCALVVDVWLHLVDEDEAGLTFEEWDPSTDTDVFQVPVAMIVNSAELRAAGFDLRELIPLQLETVTRGNIRASRPSSKFTACVPGDMYHSAVYAEMVGAE